MGLGFVLVAAFGLAVPSLYDDIGLLYGFTAVLLACAVGLQLCFLRQFKAPVQGKSLLKDVLQQIHGRQFYGSIWTRDMVK